MEYIYQNRSNKGEDLHGSSNNWGAINRLRMSSRNDYSGPLTFRLSNNSSYEKNIPRVLQNKNTRIGSLKNNLKQLQEKLKRAKNLFETSEHKKSTNQPKIIIQDFNLFTCNEEDESTMNIDSQNFFKTVAANSRRAKDYYVGMLVNRDNALHHNAIKHLKQMMDTIRATLSFSPPSVFQLQHLKVHIQRTFMNCARKTILLQLDETLLCLGSEKSSEEEIQIFVGDQKKYILLRPYALSFLKKISQHFEVIVYTRLEQEIAQAIVGEIDHQRKYITHVLTKQYCLQVNSYNLTKDIRMLDRNIRDTIIVDSSASSFIIQCDNGIPVLPFSGGQDRELVQLQRFLCREILICQDVRYLCRRWFMLCRLWQFQSELDAIQELYL